MSKNYRQRKAIVAPIAGVTDTVRSAKVSHLRYVTDDSPGIRRKRNRKSFLYYDPQGRLDRISFSISTMKGSTERLIRVM